MNINKYKFIGAFICSSIFLTSCVNNDEYEFTSTDKPVATAAQTSLTVAEGETDTITLNIDRAIGDVSMFKITVLDGDAERDLDFEIGDGPLPPDYGDPTSGYLVTIPAYSESIQIPVTAFSDLVPQEGTETVQLNISATGTRSIITQDGGINVTLNIGEVEGDNFIARLDWSATYVGTDGEEHDFCDYDLDLEFYALPGGFENGGAIVATSYSDCPEEINVSPGDLPDGQYEMVASYFSPAGAVLPTDFESIPATITIAKPGVFTEVFDYSDVWTDLAAGANEGNPNGYQTFGVLTISGSTYTVTNADTGDVIAQGRNANSNVALGTKK